jgi:cytidylate kinase
MAVVTISREFGSAGDLIAQQAAKSLGYFLVDINLIGKVLNQYGMGQLKETIEEKHNIWDRYNITYDYMIEMLNKTILTFASLDDSVILGRGGYVVLSQYPNVLNVCISSPFEKRVNNILNSQKLENYSEAEKLVAQKDKARESFLGTFYAVNGKEYKLFDLVINTGQISSETAVQWIVEAVREIGKREINPYQGTRGIETSTILKNAVLDVIAEFKFDQSHKKET